MPYQLITRSRRLLADTVTPVGLFLRLRDQYANCLLLESADYHGQQNAFSYLVCEPLATFELRRGGVLRQLLPGAPETTEILVHPREALGRLRDFAAAGTPDASAGKLPFISTGLFGYMGYEAVQSFEDVHLDPAKVPAGDVPLAMQSLTPEQRQQVMAERMNSPEMQQRGEQRAASGIKNTTPEQRVDRLTLQRCLVAVGEQFMQGFGGCRGNYFGDSGNEI